jgi:hypothetical protein
MIACRHDRPIPAGRSLGSGLVGRGEGRVGISGSVVAIAALAPLAIAAVLLVAGSSAAPRVRADATLLSATRNDVLSGNRFVAAISATGRQRVRAYVELVRGSDAAVASQILSLRPRDGRTRRVSLRLNSAGRTMLETCARSRARLVVLADRGVRSRPLPLLTREEALSDGGAGCVSPPAGQTIDVFDDPARCDPTDQAVCLFPFPNDLYTVADRHTATGRRVSLSVSSMPANVAGVRINPRDHNRNDGFSPGSMMITHIPRLVTQKAFDRSGIVPLTDMARGFDRGQPVVVIDAATKARQLIWAEVDANPRARSDASLIIRPGRNLREGHRYIVAIRRLRDADGAPISPGDVFRAYRDDVRTRSSALEARRSHYEQLFRTLAQAGIDRSDLYLAWDFTVASERSLSERMLAIRNDAFARLGDRNLANLKVEGAAPHFTVDKVTENPDGPAAPVLRRVEGTVTVPCYLDLPGCPTGSRFSYPAGSSIGPPAWNPGNSTTARFTCQIPRVALGGRLLRPGIYGHGLLGSRGEIEQGQLKALGQEHGFLFCATDWIGMACADVDIPPDQNTLLNIVDSVRRGRLPNLPNCDLPNIATILLDLSNLPSLVDRVQQAIVNFFYLGRALIHAQGFSTNAAFQINGKSVIRTGRLYYDGNSQGGIIGGELISVAPDLDRGVIGVPGMNYSTLLRRSVDFDRYAQILYTSYPSELERPLVLALMQMLWDRAEADGYAQHMTSDPYPNTPAHRVLMHGALGDHQVSQFAAEVEARTIGASVRTPYADRGRYAGRVPIFDIPAITRFPFAGSAFVLWDSGPIRTVNGAQHGTAVPPAPELPPRAGDDPHEYPRRSAAARRQKSEFLRPGGRVIDVCAPRRACYDELWTGP